jgi:hypothetical protein
VKDWMTIFIPHELLERAELLFPHLLDSEWSEWAETADEEKLLILCALRGMSLFERELGCHEQSSPCQKRSGRRTRW